MRGKLAVTMALLAAVGATLASCASDPYPLPSGPPHAGQRGHDRLIGGSLLLAGFNGVANRRARHGPLVDRQADDSGVIEQQQIIAQHRVALFEPSGIGSHGRRDGAEHQRRHQIDPNH